MRLILTVHYGSLALGLYLIVSRFLYDQDQTTDIVLTLGGITCLAVSAIFAGFWLLKKELEALSKKLGES